MRNAEKWYFMYSLAKKYYEHHGNLNIKAKFKTKNGYEYDENGYNLGAWINTQKAAYKNNKAKKKVNRLDPLTSKQIELLENIGMKWGKQKSSWYKTYSLVKEYYIHYGTLDMPSDFKTKNGYEYDENGVNISVWLSQQRHNFNHNKLSVEKISLLNEIGMLWKLGLTWEEMYALAKNYYELHGDLRVSRHFKTKNGYEYDKNGYNLGEWISTQRVAYKNNIAGKKVNSYRPLTEEQIKLLESIGMIWRVEVFNYKTRLESLLKALTLEYNFNFLDYPEILSLSTNEVIERTLYLKEHRLPFANNGKLNPLFFEKKEEDKGLILKH